MPLGIVPDAGALQRLPRLIPRNIANEMFLMGRKMTADVRLIPAILERLDDLEGKSRGRSG